MDCLCRPLQEEGAVPNISLQQRVFERKPLLPLGFNRSAHIVLCWLWGLTRDAYHGCHSFVFLQYIFFLHTFCAAALFLCPLLNGCAYGQTATVTHVWSGWRTATCT